MLVENMRMFSMDVLMYRFTNTLTREGSECSPLNSVGNAFIHINFTGVITRQYQGLLPSLVAKNLREFDNTFVSFLYLLNSSVSYQVRICILICDTVYSDRNGQVVQL